MTAPARILPDWPCAMRKAMAASYLDLSIPAFEREVLTGNLPGPVMLDGKERWLKKLLDDALISPVISDAEKEFRQRYG